MAWTEIARGQYQRDHLRYASDTTDEEWKVIAPRSTARPIADARARPTCARSSTRSFTSRRPAANGGYCPRRTPALHHGAAVFLCVARQRRVADHQSCAADGRARTAGRKGESNRRRDRQPIGQNDRVRWPARLCGGKDDQGPQATYPDRHDRPAGRAKIVSLRPTVQDRDGRPLYCKAWAASVPLAAPHLRRWRLRRHQLRTPQNHGDWTLEIVKRSDAAKGFILLPRRWVIAHTCLAEPQPPPGKGRRGDVEGAVTWLVIASVG